MITVVLLPGMDGTARLFEPFITALEALALTDGGEAGTNGRYQTQAIAYPGDAALGYVQLEALVRAKLPRDGAFVVLGESFSGPIAAALAADPPAGLVGVVLCCSFVRNPRPVFSSPVFSPLVWLMRFVPMSLAPIQLLSVTLLGKHSSSAWRAALKAALAPVPAAALHARLQAVRQVNALPQISAARVPVLYLRATEDGVVPARAVRDIVKALPSVTVVSIAGPHFLLQVCPEPAAAAVHKFVEGLGVRRA